MAYTKTTWNNLSDPPINAENLNKIEQGIYNNSLGIDIINPSGTATTTAEIEEGQINDVIGFKSLKLKGQTSQYTTTGKNLLEDDTFVQGSYLDNTSTIRISCRNTKLKANKTYTLSSTLNYSNYNIAIVTSENQFPLVDGSSVVYDSGWKSANVNFTVGSNDVYINIAIKKLPDGTTLTPNDVKGIKFQIEEGTSATSYEKYTGGKASPNPDFPQDVNNVSGDNVIKISNKNLWGDLSFTKISGGLTFVLNKDGSITISGTSTGANASSMLVSEATSNNIFVTLQAGTYTVSGGGSNYQIQIYSTSGTSLASTAVGQASKTFTLNEETDLFCRILVPNSNTTLNKTIYVQLEKGSSATSYKAHQGNNFSIDLPVENKLPYPYVQTTRTAEGITYTDLGDGRIKINGTATANSAFKLLGEASSQVAIPGNYVYGGVNSNVRVRAMNRTSSGTYTTLGSSIGSSTLINKGTYETGYVEISIASGTTVNNLIITPMLSDNEVNAYTPYGTNPIYLGEIGTDCNDIRKYNGKWYWHKEIGKIVLDGSEALILDGELTNTNRFRLNITSYGLQSMDNQNTGLNNQLQMFNDYNNDSEHLYSYKSPSTGNIQLYVFYNKTRCADLAGLQTYLSTNNLIIYGILNKPIDEEITYTPLIRQLDELYNSGLYDVTNISQDNSGEVFILDIEACKNNINGIVEYIRR